MSALMASDLDLVRRRNDGQSWATEVNSLRFALQRLLDAAGSDDPDEMRLARIQAMATLKQSEINARGRVR